MNDKQKYIQGLMLVDYMIYVRKHNVKVDVPELIDKVVETDIPLSREDSHLHN